MNRPLFAVLAVVCFAAGWGMDALVAASLHEDAMQKRAGASAAAAKSHPPAEGGVVAPRSMPPKIPAAGLSVNDLLSLITPGSPNASRVRLDEAVAGLAAAELAALAEECKTVAKDWRREAEIRPVKVAVLERWLAVEPARAAEHIVPSYGSGDRMISPLKRAFAAAIGVLVQQDFEKATALAARIHDRELYIDVRWEWVHSLKGMEPAEGMQLIVDFDAKTRNQWHNAQILGDFPKRWIAKDAPAAMNWALQIPPGYSHEYILGQLTEEWAKVNPAEAGAFLNGVPLTVLPNGPLREELAIRVQKRKTPGNK